MPPTPWMSQLLAVKHISATGQALLSILALPITPHASMGILDRPLLASSCVSGNLFQTNVACLHLIALLLSSFVLVSFILSCIACLVAVTYFVSLSYILCKLAEMWTVKREAVWQRVTGKYPRFANALATGKMWKRGWKPKGHWMTLAPVVKFSRPCCVRLMSKKSVEKKQSESERSEGFGEEEIQENSQKWIAYVWTEVKDEMQNIRVDCPLTLRSCNTPKKGNFSES